MLELIGSLVTSNAIPHFINKWSESLRLLLCCGMLSVVWDIHMYISYFSLYIIYFNICIYTHTVQHNISLSLSLSLFFFFF